jgi:hypothetical protein
MSHSQFHSDIFILRRAWLNLWDERMTTGRINQVTSIPFQDYGGLIQNKTIQYNSIQYNTIQYNTPNKYEYNWLIA